MFVSTARTATATTPAGWTLRSVVTDSDVRSWVFTRSRRRRIARVDGPGLVRRDLQGRPHPPRLLRCRAAQRLRCSRPSPVRTALHALALGCRRHRRFDRRLLLGRQGARAAHGWTLPAGRDARSATAGTGSGLVTATSGDASDSPSGHLAGVDRQRRHRLGQGRGLDGRPSAGLRRRLASGALAGRRRRPPTQVDATRAAPISSVGPANGSRSSTTRSATWPGASTPAPSVRSRPFTQAEPDVYAANAVVRSTACSGRNGARPARRRTTCGSPRCGSRPAGPVR